MRLSLQIATALALSTAALVAQAPLVLSTGFGGASANSGIMFDIVAGPGGVTIDHFDTNLSSAALTPINFAIYKVTVPGAFFPHANIAADWTLVGTATGILSNGPNVPTLVPISVCEYIPPNAKQGFLICCTDGNTVRYLNQGLAVPAYIPGQVAASNADLTIEVGTGMGYAAGPVFTGGGLLRVAQINCGYFQGLATNCSQYAYATKVNYGIGCYANPRQVHELFLGATTIDLINTNWTLQYVAALPGSPGPTYLVGPGTNPYDSVVPAIIGEDLVHNSGAGGGGAGPVTPPLYSSSTASAPVGLWDDGSVVKTLPFNFPFANPGSPTTNAITINSNCKIYLGDTGVDNTYGSTGANSGYAVTSFNGTTGALLATVAGLMCDMDPEAAGYPTHIWYEDPSPNGGVRISWECPNWWDGTFSPTGGMCYVQMELLPNGNINLAYGSSLSNGGSVGNDANVGYSGGSGQPAMPSVDWSTLNNYATGNGLVALQLDGDVRPVLGNTVNFTVSQIPAGSVVGAVVYGQTNFGPAGIPGILIGMPGCQIYTSPDFIDAGLFPGTTFPSSLPIPVNPSLIGAAVEAQGLVLNVAIPNSFQGITSNGVALVLGNL